MYVVILFGLSTLVRLPGHVLMYVVIFFGLSTLVRLVRPCSHVCCYFIRSEYVSTLSTAMSSCMLVFYSVLVR